MSYFFFANPEGRHSQERKGQTARENFQRHDTGQSATATVCRQRLSKLRQNPVFELFDSIDLTFLMEIKLQGQA